MNIKFFTTGVSIEDLTEVPAPVGEGLFDLLLDCADYVDFEVSDHDMECAHDVLEGKLRALYEPEWIDNEEVKLQIQRAMSDAYRDDLENHVYNLIKDDMEDMANDTKMRWHWEDKKGNKCEFYEAEAMHLACSKKLWRTIVDTGEYSSIYSSYAQAEEYAEQDLEEWVNECFNKINIDDNYYPDASDWIQLFKESEEISLDVKDRYEKHIRRLKQQIKAGTPYQYREVMI